MISIPPTYSWQKNESSFALENHFIDCLHPFWLYTLQVLFIPQLIIFFGNVQMWEVARWSTASGRKPPQELQRSRSHEGPQMLVYIFHDLKFFWKTCMVFSHISPDIFCCKIWRIIRNGAAWLNLVPALIICIKAYLYTVQCHQLFLWRYGGICFGCLVMMTMPNAMLFREQFCS